MLKPTVQAVHRSAGHSFSKTACERINLRTGLGVEGDAHCGATIKHRSRVKADPSQPNLRQVHLIHQELIDQLRAQNFRVGPGDMGENITTAGLDILGLPTGTLLHLGAEAIIEVTGLRNPCSQLNAFQDGLMQAVLDKDAEGNLIRKCGVMAIVKTSGLVRPGDPIKVALPAGAHRPLEKV